MIEKEWVEVEGQQWSLTQVGYEAAENLYKQQ